MLGGPPPGIAVRAEALPDAGFQVATLASENGIATRDCPSGCAHAPRLDRSGAGRTLKKRIGTVTVPLSVRAPVEIR